ncbi:MAG: DUF5801 repeats-in-toxin domain-containing protein [Rhizobiaceae bacterium]
MSATDTLVDEDDLPNGNDDDMAGDDDPDASGAIDYAFGADDVASVVLSTAGNTTSLTTLYDDPIDTIWVGNQLIGYVRDSDHIQTANQVFTVTVTGFDNAQATYEVNLLQPVKHPDQDDSGTGDEETAFEDNLSIDVTATVTDADGSEATVDFTVEIDDDIPVVEALPVEFEFQPIANTIERDGNRLYQDAKGEDGFDILLTGMSGASDVNVNPTDTGEGIHVGSGPGIAVGERLRLDFVKNLAVTGNPTNTFTADEHYSTEQVSFDVPFVMGGGEAVMFIQLYDVDAGEDNSNDTANFNDDPTVEIADIQVSAGTPTIEAYHVGGVIVGYVVSGVPQGATITVTGTEAFERVAIQNFNGTPFNNGTSVVSRSGAANFGIDSPTAYQSVPASLTVLHDETAGEQAQSDDSAGPIPTVLADAIATDGGLTEIGRARSEGSLGILFDVSMGADRQGSRAYELVKADGGAFDGEDSGLDTLGGDDIKLYSDGNIVWGVAGDDLDTGTRVFAAHVGVDGKMHVVQFEPIAHGDDGASDDVESTLPGLIHVKLTATDADGDAASAVSETPIQLSFRDDGPVALADTGGTSEGGTLVVDAEGGVLSNDTEGTDGAEISGVRAANGDTSNPASGSVGVAIQGAYGWLTLNADGSYTYVADQNSTTTGVEDVFVYTITDGDGDTSTTTLTIDVADVTLAPQDASNQVSEAALDGVADDRDDPAPDDLAPGTVDGSDAQTDGETVAGQAAIGTGVTVSHIQGATGDDVDDTGPVTISGQYGELRIDHLGNYVYTLTSPADHSGGPVSDDFTYEVTDAFGNTATATISIEITDDGVLARDDTGDVNEGRTLSVDAASGVLANDGESADAPSVVSHIVALHGGAELEVVVSATVFGQYGMLTIRPDGSYTYIANPNLDNQAGLLDEFSYTVTDADGTESNAFLTITVNDGIPAADAAPVTLELDEAAIDASGTEPASDAETDATPALSFIAGDDALVAFAFASDVSGLETDFDGDGNQDVWWQRDANGSEVRGYLDAAMTDQAVELTLSAPGSIGQYTVGDVTVTATILKALPHPDGLDDQVTPLGSVTVEATDTDGDVARGVVSINVKDDTPTANPDGAELGSQRTIRVGADAGVLANDEGGADGLPGAPDMTPDGGDEIVVSDTDGLAQTAPVVTALPDGGYVVIWESRAEGFGTPPRSVVGQRYDTDGNTVGTQFTVSSATSTNSMNPSVAALADGGFVVTWNRSFGAPDGEELFARVYESNGTPGAEIEVNTTTAGNQLLSSVIGLPDGDFLVVWDTDLGGGNREIMARRFNADGSPEGGEFQVNDTLAGIDSNVVAATLEDGSYVIAWSSAQGDPDGYGVRARHFSADGTPTGVEFVVNTTTAEEQSVPSIAALADGGFVVAWRIELGGADFDIRAQRFAADGTPVDGEISVNVPNTFPFQQNPNVTGLADGGFVVTWESSNEDGNSYGVFGQRFDAGGQPVGEQFQLNTTTAGSQMQNGGSPSIVELADGSIAVVWSSQPAVTANSEAHIVSRIFDMPRPPVVTGVEAGDDDSAPVTGGVGEVIQGQYGKLILHADGSYSYTRDGNTPGGVEDVFVYTIRDNDGDPSTATLTVTLDDETPSVTVPATDGPTTTVDEAALGVRSGEPAGSDSASDDETAEGTIGFTSPDGVGAITIGTTTFDNPGELTTLAAATPGAPVPVNDDDTGTLWVIGYEYDEATGQGTIAYRYTLKDNTSGDPSSVAFPVVVTDLDGESAPASSLTIAINDDAPTANEDTILAVTDADGATAGANLLDNDVQGADGATLTHVNLGSGWQAISGAPIVVADVGTFTFAANGEWTFDPDPAAGGQTVTFSYRITDGDGDPSEAEQDIAIQEAGSDFTVTGSVTGKVEEEHIDSAQAQGNDDTTSESTDPNEDEDVPGDLDNTTDVQVGDFSGLAVTGADGALSYSVAPVTTGMAVMKSDGTPLTSHGQQVVYAKSGDTLIGYVEGSGTGFNEATDRKVFTLEVNEPADGQWTFTQFDNVDHHTVGSADDVEDIIGIDLGGRVRVADQGGNATTIAEFDVNVIDDTPAATPVEVGVPAGGKDTNIMLILDMSGSMDQGSKLAQTKAAAVALINAYDELGDVKVNIVLMRNGDAIRSPIRWNSGQEAIDYINSTQQPPDGLPNPFGETNYTAGTQRAMEAWDHVQNEPKIDGAETVSYFISDGNPTTGGWGDPQEAAWTEFLNDNDILSYALGIGDAGLANLNRVAYDGRGDGEDINGIRVNNLNQLTDALVGTVSSVQGNLLVDESGPTPVYRPGADGGHVESIKVGDVTYTFDDTANTIAETGTPPPGYVDHGTWAEIPTPEGGTLTFFFEAFGTNEAGSWSYIAPTQAGVQEVFEYTLVDGDGDRSTSTLTIDVTESNQPPQGTDSTLAINEDAAPVALTAANFGFSDPNNSPADDFHSVRIMGLTGGGTLFLGTTPIPDFPVDVTAQQIANGDLTYQPAANGNGAGYATVSFRVIDDGGTDDGGLDTDPTPNKLTIDVTPVNDAPQIAGLGDAPLAYTEDQTAQRIDTAVTVTDIDSTNMNGGSLTVAVTGNPSTDDVLSIVGNGSGGNQISVNGNNIRFGGTAAANNIATFTGGTNGDPLVITFNSNNATPAAVDRVIESIGYSNTSNDPSTAQRTLTYTLNDGDGTANGGQDTVIGTATVNVTARNDAPTLDNGASPALAPVLEDAAAPVNAVGTLVSDLVDPAGGGGVNNVTDPDGPGVGIALTGKTGSGTWWYSLDDGASWTDVGTVTNASALLLPDDARLYFQPSANATGAASITFRAWDESGAGVAGTKVSTATNGDTTPFSSTTDTVSLTVTPVNDAPTIGDLGDAPITYTENAAATRIDTAVAVADIDSTNMNGGSLTVAVTGNGTPEDVLSVVGNGSGANTIHVANVGGINYIRLGTNNVAGNNIATFTGGTNGDPLVITFINDNATVAAVDRVVESIAFSNTSDNPSTAQRTVTYTLVDGDGTANGGADTATATATVTVNASNDAPLVSGLSVTESGISFIVDDPDSTDLTVQGPLAAGFGSPTFANGPVTLTPVPQPSAISGTLFVTDGAASSSVIVNLVMIGTDGADGLGAGAASTAIYGFGGDDTLTGGAANDWIFGGTGNDTITGGGGADQLYGGADDDTFNIGGTGQFASGEVINGGDGTDTIAITSTSNNATYNFTIGTIENIENLTALGNNQIVQLTAAQWAGLNDIDLGGGSDTLDVNVTGSQDVSLLGITNLTGVESRGMSGSGGDDTLTLTTAQLNAFITGGTTVGINLAGGSDTVTLADGGSVDLTSVAFNSVERLTGAPGGNSTVSMTTDQWDNFTEIDLGDGADTLNVVASAASVNITGLSSPTMNGIENRNLVVSNTGVVNHTVTMTAQQWTGFTSIDLAGGAGDILNVTTSGTVDISSAGTPSHAAIETRNLTGSTNADTVTLSATQFASFTSIGLGGNTSDVLNVVVAGPTDISGLTSPTVLADVDSRNLVGSGGDDTVTMTAEQLSTFTSSGNRSINLGGGTDTLILTTAITGTFGNFAASTFSGVEHIAVTTGSVADNITLTAQQWANLDSIDLGNGANTVTVQLGGPAGDISGLGLPAISNVNSVELNGTTGNDSITLTGEQLNAFTSIALSSGTDTISITSTSAGLNGMSDGNLSGVETISASTAAAGVTIDLSSQSAEGFVVTGSNFADTLIGGAKVDFITGGEGNDFLYGGGEDDRYLFRFTGDGHDTIDETTGGGNNDTISIAASGQAFSEFDFERVDIDADGADDLRIRYNGQTITVVNQYDGAPIKFLTISGGGSFHGYTSPSTSYAFVSTGLEGTAGEDLIVGTSAGGTLNGLGSNDLLFGGSAVDTLNGGDGNDLLVGGAGNDTLNGGNNGDTLVGGADDDTMTGGAGLDRFVVDAGIDTITDLGTTGSGQEVLVVSAGATANATVTSGWTAGAETVNNGTASLTSDGFAMSVLAAGGSAGWSLTNSSTSIAANLTGSARADTLTTAGGGGTIDAGLGGDTVVINAGTATRNWTVNLGVDSSADKVVFNHADVGIGHNTLATVNQFNVSHDKVAIALAGTSITDGGFQTIDSTGGTAILAGTEVIELHHTDFTSGSLTADGDNGAIETEIADAIGAVGEGTYTVIVYTGPNTSNADAGIYTMTVQAGGSANLTTGQFTIEHVMTLDNVGFGNLGAGNFAVAADPIILDLDGNGVTFASLEDGVAFDLDADGTKDKVAWNSSRDGMLAMDLNGDGAIDDGRELFTPNFNGGSFATGGEALASLDGNGDGVIDQNDEAYGRLSVWQDLNGDGVTDEGELKSLADHGIASISVETSQADEVIDGQAVIGEGSFTRTDGSTGEYIEVELDAVSGAGEEAETLTSDVPGDEDDADAQGDDEETQAGDAAEQADDAAPQQNSMTGDDGENIIAGGLGAHLLTGTSGADTFRVFDAGLTAKDIIADYSFTQGDTIDLGGVLTAAFGNDADRVRLTQDGSDVTLQVDITGAGAWADVATLPGYGTPGADPVRVLFDGDNETTYSV